jgi:oligopeptide transport system substrate-binding protein
MFFSQQGLKKSLGVTLLSLSSLALISSQNVLASQKSLTERKASGEVYWNSGDEPPSMDPTKQADAVSGTWLAHLYEGLTTTDKNGALVMGTAEKMSVSADGKTYTFKIKKNAKWHDGKPVRAQDFEYAFKRLVDPKFASEYSFIAETAQIVNAKEIIAKTKQTSELGAKALDDATFEVKLLNPVVFFPSLMYFNVFFPVRQDLVEKFGDKFSVNAESVVGNGPFKLAKWQKEAGMRLEKADTYWNASSVKLTAIETPSIIKDNTASYNSFRTGGLDATGLDIERVKQAQKDKVQIKNFQEGTVFFLEMNQRPGKAFENLNLRKAVSLALNRKEYVSKISGIPSDKPATGLVPDIMPGSTPKISYRKESGVSLKDADMKGAKEALNAYLAETKQAKVPTFTILSGDSSVAKRDVEYFQNHLSKVLNAEVKIDTVPFKTRVQKMRDAQFDIVIAGWGPDYIDAMTFADLFISGNGNNHTGFANKKYDELIDKARVTGDVKERIKLMAEAEKMLLNEQYVIAPFYQRGVAYTLSEGLQGVRRPIVGGMYDFRHAFWAGATAKK